MKCAVPFLSTQSDAVFASVRRLLETSVVIPFESSSKSNEGGTNGHSFLETSTRCRDILRMFFTYLNQHTADVAKCMKQAAEDEAKTSSSPSLVEHRMMIQALGNILRITSLHKVPPPLSPLSAGSLRRSLIWLFLRCSASFGGCRTRQRSAR